jgi:hypothetical protein
LLDKELIISIKSIINSLKNGKINQNIEKFGLKVILDSNVCMDTNVLQKNIIRCIFLIADWRFL